MSNITLSVPGRSLGLRSYEHGNTRMQDLNVVVAADQTVRVDHINPYRLFTFDVGGLPRNTADDFLAFVEATQGLIVTVVDNIYGHTYQGVIESPEVSRHKTDLCKDTVSFVLNTVDDWGEEL
jgi:hypothetical protein